MLEVLHKPWLRFGKWSWYGHKSVMEQSLDALTHVRVIGVEWS